MQSGLPFFGAALFPWGFATIVLFGMELVTGNFALIATAMLAGKVRFHKALKNWLWVYLGNFIGCLIVAILMSYSLTDRGTIEPNAVIYLPAKCWLQLAGYIKFD